MQPIKLLAAALVLTGLAAPGRTADYSDPTWPCIQRKVETLSLGLMWPHPVETDELGDAETAREIADLAETLSLRRVDLEDMRVRVEAFAAAHDGDRALLGRVFADVFDRLSERRGRIIRGIGDFSLGQAALADKIEQARLEMDRLMAAEAPDYDRIDAVEEQIDWDQVIYTDRQQSITYLCETPTLLEKRLYAIAQMLQQVAN